MTMHLVGPALSMNGKKKGKVKFRNADQARKSRELDASWEEIQKKWGVALEDKKRKRALAAQPLSGHYSLAIPSNRSTAHIPSRDTGLGNATLKPAKQYTGTKVKGIATMHKSNAVPVFSDEEAIEISKMRRG